MDLFKADTAEKVGDIQLQEIPFAHMGRGVAAESAALSISGGLRCDRQIGEEIPADLPLPATQCVVRHGQRAHSSVTLGDGDGVVRCRRVPRIVKELLPAGREKRRQLPPSSKYETLSCTLLHGADLRLCLYGKALWRESQVDDCVSGPYRVSVSMIL